MRERKAHVEKERGEGNGKKMEIILMIEMQKDGNERRKRKKVGHMK